MMPFADAIRATKDGVVIDFEVSPGAKSVEVPSGYNPWRKRIEARIRAPPERGRANEELVEALARLLNVPAVSIEIMTGATASRKSVMVRGMAREDVIEALRGRV